MKSASLAAFAGAALVACISGSAAALAAMPCAIIAASSIVVLYAAFSAHRASSIPWIAGGALFAMLLPITPPPAPGGVSTHGVSRGVSGDLFALLDRLDVRPDAVIGTRVSVTGTWTPGDGGGDATVSRRIVNCCAADALDVGFDVEPIAGVKGANGKWVRVTGVVRVRMEDGEVRYALTSAVVDDP